MKDELDHLGRDCLGMVTVDRHRITLVPRSTTGFGRAYGLMIDGVSRGELNLSSNYRPNLAFGLDQVAIWCGPNIFVAHLAEHGEAVGRDIGDFIGVVYEIFGYWCLICDLSITLLDPITLSDKTRYQHDEIITKSWWSDEHLHVEDLQGRQLSFRMKVSEAEGVAIVRA